MKTFNNFYKTKKPAQMGILIHNSSIKNKLLIKNKIDLSTIHTLYTKTSINE